MEMEFVTDSAPGFEAVDFDIARECFDNAVYAVLFTVNLTAIVFYVVQFTQIGVTAYKFCYFPPYDICLLLFCSSAVNLCVRNRVYITHIGSNDAGNKRFPVLPCHLQIRFVVTPYSVTIPTENASQNELLESA